MDRAWSGGIASCFVRGNVVASSRWVGLGDPEPRMCSGFVLHTCALAFPLGERSAASRCFQDVPQSIYQVYSQALLPDFHFFFFLIEW